MRVRLVYAAAAVLFCAWALPRLTALPPYPDEAYHAVAAGMLTEGPLRTCVVAAPFAAGRLPWMSNEHTGLPDPYLFYPVWKLLGVNVLAMRLIEALGAAVALLLWALAAEEWFGARSAAAAAPLLLLYAPLAVSGLLGMTNDLPMLWGLLAGFLLALGRWRRTRAPRALYAAAFLGGFGLWTKLVFVLFLAPAAAWWAMETRGRRGRWPQAALALAWLLLGAAPLLAFNAWAGGQTVVVLVRSLIERTPLAVDNGRFLPNLALRLSQLHQLVTLRRLSAIAVDGPFERHPLLGLCGYLYLAPIALGAWAAARGRLAGRREWLSWAALAAFCFLGLCFTVTRFDLRQLIWFLPLAGVLSGHALACRLRGDGALTAAVTGLLLPSLLVLSTFDLYLDRHRPLRPLEQAGAWLRERGIDRPVLIMDPGEENTLFLLSGGFVRPSDTVRRLWPDKPAEAALDGQSPVFVALRRAGAPPAGLIDPAPAFARVLRGMRAARVARFEGEDGPAVEILAPGGRLPGPAPAAAR